MVDRLKDDIVWLGHASVVIRRDNEPAIARVVEKVTRVLKNSEGVTASWEGSVPYDPQTNGHAEGAVRLLKGMLRTLLLGLEKKVQVRIPLRPSYSCMVYIACSRCAEPACGRPRRQDRVPTSTRHS